jgi:hypothetical protein
MRSTLLLILCLLVYKYSFSQNEIKKSKEFYGIYNEKTKKWVLQPNYTKLAYLKIYENANEDNFNKPYLLANDKKGAVIIDAKTFKAISPIYKSIELISEANKLLIIKNKNEEFFYQIGIGVLTERGSFDSHERFYYNGKLLLKKGESTCLYEIDNLRQGPFIDGKIMEEFYSGNKLFKKNGHYGVLDSLWNKIVPNEYDSIVDLSGLNKFENYFALKKQNKWGIVDSKNKLLTPFIYDDINFRIFDYMFGYVDTCINIYVVKKDNKWSFIKPDNTNILKTEFDSIISYIHPGNFEVIKDNKRGIIDLKGNTIFPFTYKYFERTNYFSGEAQSQKYYFVNNTCVECKPLETEGGWGFADSTGKLLQEMNANIIPLRLYDKSQYENLDSSNYGYLWNVGGKKIKEIISVDSVESEQYDPEGNPYYVKYAQFEYSYYLNGGKTGIINNKGILQLPINNEDLVLPLVYFRGEGPETPENLITLNQVNKAYESTYCLSNSNLVKCKRNNKWGVSNLLGKVIIPCAFDSIQDFEINRYEICEVSDSIQNTLNFQLKQFICFKDGIKYFFKENGEFLSKHLKEEKTISILNFVLKAPNKGDYFYSPQYHLIAINPTDDFYKVTFDKEEFELFDENGEYISNRIVKVERDFYIPEASKLNFYNPLTQKYIFSEPVEDFMMLTDRGDRGIKTINWSTKKDKIKFITSIHNYETQASKIEGKNLQTFPSYKTIQNAGRFDSTIFIKQNSKWYLRNLNEPNFRNKIGFDSVFVNSNHSFIAYNNGSFSTYNFNELNFDKTKINFVFPDYGDYRLACSSCEYSYIEKKTKMPQFIYDSEGNEIQGDTIHSITKIPLITKGKLNITNNYGVPILEKWVDEIIFPKCNGTNQHTNLNDKNDFLYSQPFIFDSELSNIYNAKSIAYRIDKEWYLITLDENKTLQGPFDTIKNEGSVWITTKEGETKKYKTSDFSEE